MYTLRLFVPTTTNPLVGLLMARQVSGLSPQKATPPPSVESPPPIPKTSKTSSKKSMKATPKSRKRAEPEADDDDDSEAAPTAKRPKVSKGTKGRPTQTRKDDFAEVDAPKGKKAQKSRAAAKPTARMGKRGTVLSGQSLE